MEERIATASLEVEADAATIFELIADPARQPEWDGNDNLAAAAPGQRVHAVGDMFVMEISNPARGGPLRQNRVVEFEEGRLIAWLPSEVDSPPPGHLWRWELTPLSESRTLVTHTYDWSGLHDEFREKRARRTTAEWLTSSLVRLSQVAEHASG